MCVPFLAALVSFFPQKKKLVDDVSEREAALVPGSRKEPVRYRWDEGGFYSTLTERVKTHFLEKYGQRGVDPRKASVNRFVKVGSQVVCRCLRQQQESSFLSCGATSVAGKGGHALCLSHYTI